MLQTRRSRQSRLQWQKKLGRSTFENQTAVHAEMVELVPFHTLDTSFNLARLRAPLSPTTDLHHCSLVCEYFFFIFSLSFPWLTQDSGFRLPTYSQHRRLSLSGLWLKLPRKGIWLLYVLSQQQLMQDSSVDLYLTMARCTLTGKKNVYSSNTTIWILIFCSHIHSSF